MRENHDCYSNPWPSTPTSRTASFRNENGQLCFRWVDTQKVLAMACDILIPGYGGKHVTNMRLWAAQSSLEFDLCRSRR